MINSLLYLFLLVFTPAFAQLQEFNLQVTSTDETCSGNGTLTFSVTNTTPGATMTYTVYKQPDLVNPISISSASSLGSLSQGTYKIIATQTLGQSTNTQEAEAIITQSLNEVTFTVSATNQTCADGAIVTVNVTGGTPTRYEIFSGPVTVPAQDSNVFEGIPPGKYVIRVFNECGDANVTTFTVPPANTPPAISDPVYEASSQGDCDSVTITNTISYGEGINITYPVTIEYVLTPNNGGDPITITQTFASGDAVELSLTQTFATSDAGYAYSIKITDGCNTSFTKDGMVLNPELAVIFTPNVILPCGQHYLSLNVSNYTPPYSVNFIDAPDGFDPVAFNPAHPGPFNTDSVVYGSNEQAVNTGDYKVEVTDSCGKLAIIEFTIIDEDPDPSFSGSNNGCNSLFGKIGITVPNRKIVSAIIVDAPDAYTSNHTLPDNVSAKINGTGQLVLLDMPLGKYTIKIVDECGKQYEVEVEVPPFEPKGFIPTAMTGCIQDSGAIRVVSENGKLSSLSITSAPLAFTESLPFDVSSYIDNNGVFYMDGLPPGGYTLSGQDICGIQDEVSLVIDNGNSQSNAVVFTRNCGTFDLGLADTQTVNLSDPPTYWLQKKLNSTSWGHPVSGVAYPEGTMPTIQNSIALTNGQTLYGLEYEGEFRVIKYFQSYISPNNLKYCFGALDTFEYHDGVTVKSVYNLSCYNTSSIYVDATGLAPLHYTIDRMDGMPYAFDNGNNSIFSGLAPGIYQFVVEDACGYVGRIEVNIRQLPELTNANNPGDMQVCIEDNGTFIAQFNLLDQNAEILGDQPADLYTITYHKTYEDADNGVNALPTTYTNTTTPEILYARLIHNYIPLCHDIVAFTIRVSKYPVLKIATDYVLCDTETEKVLVADHGFNSYVWSTGETTQSITVQQPGNYWVKVGNEFDGVICETEADISVILSGPPESWSLKVEDWTDKDNRIIVNTTGKGNYEYSLDDKVYQDLPIFDNLKTGVYTVYVRDKNGCGMVSREVVLLNYPKFFTPNNDGINDKWRLEYSWFEPEALIYIYDRYGKLLTSFTPTSAGWDGTFNGERLPSTDYWFVVLRKDGRVHKGHFSMLR